MQDLILTKITHTLPHFKTKVQAAINSEELKTLQADNPSVVPLGEAPLLEINPKTAAKKGTWVSLDMQDLSKLIQNRYQSPKDLADEFTQGIVNFSKRTNAILIAGAAGALTFCLTKSSFPQITRLKMPAVVMGVGAFLLNAMISTNLINRKLKYIQMKPLLDAQAVDKSTATNH